MEYGKELVDITPDKSLMLILGYTGYSISEAIAELVDNAIDERIDGKLLTVRVNVLPTSISVEDDAKGMTKDVAKDALILGKSTKINKPSLGLYGLGLKTACASLGRRYSISTKTMEEGRRYILEFDENKWLNNPEATWHNFPIHWVLAPTDEHGTKVEVDLLKKNVKPNLASKILSDFSVRYAIFLKSRIVRIFVNKKQCYPQEPELIEKHEFRWSLPSGNVISGWYGLLKTSSQKGYYGFTTYRNNRMITVYDKIGYTPHPTVARVVGEIHLNHVPVTHDKRDFIRDSEEFLEVDTIFRVKSDFKEMLRRAKLPYVEKDFVQPEGGTVRVQKQSQPTIGDMLEHTVQVLTEAETHPYGSLSPNNIQKQTIEAQAQSKPEENVNVKDEPIASVRLRVRSDDLILAYYQVKLGTDGPMDWFDRKKHNIRVETNVDFPAFKATRDRYFYAALVISLVLNNLYSEKFPENDETSLDIYTRILRKAPELVKQLRKPQPSSWQM